MSTAGDHVPADRGYHVEHGWAQVGGDSATVGITWYAQDQLGDVLSVWAPDVGAVLVAGEPYGEVESIKSLSDLVAPVSGEVTEVNPGLSSAADLVNRDPFGAGWIAKVRLTGPTGALLDAAAYRALVDPEATGPDLSGRELAG